MNSQISVSYTKQRVANGTLLGHFFSRNVWGNLVEQKSDCLYDAVVRRYISPYCDDVNKSSNRDVLRSIYRLISRQYRNEYFYRNELLRHFTSEHSKTRDAIALSQLKVGRSRADFVLLNGTAAIYEIKTDQDTFFRLDAQLTDYYKAFPFVYVVVGQSHLADAMSRYGGTDVGICKFTPQRKFQCVKEAKEKRAELCHKTMFDVLHVEELGFVMSYLGLPSCANVEFDAYSKKLRMFSSVDMDTLYPVFQMALKSRMKRLSWSLFRRWPPELAALAYFWSDRVPVTPAIDGFLESRYEQFDKDKNKLERMQNVCGLLSIL